METSELLFWSFALPLDRLLEWSSLFFEWEEFRLTADLKREILLLWLRFLIKLISEPDLEMTPPVFSNGKKQTSLSIKSLALTTDRS